jgi:hypothetical protein
VQTTTPAPAPTAPAAAPPTPAATVPAGCHPHGYEDACYRPAGHCRWSHHRMGGVAGDAWKIMCGKYDRWRSESA